MTQVRVALGLILIPSLALLATIRTALLMAGLIGAGAIDTDSAVLAERRFRRVKDKLPPRGVYGFRALGPLRVGKNHEVEGDDRSITQYVLAQYALAPRILDLFAAHPIVIR